MNSKLDRLPSPIAVLLLVLALPFVLMVFLVMMVWEMITGKNNEWPK